MHCKGCLNNGAFEASLLQVGGKLRAFNERQIAAFGVFLALRYNQLRVREGLDDCLDFFRQLKTGAEAPMTVGNLVVARSFRMRPHKYRRLLSGCADAVNQASELRISCSSESILDERRFNQTWI